MGDFINHGKSLQTNGTSIVILLSLLENVDSIDVFCPEENDKTEEFELPSKVILREFYRYGNSKSILRLLKIPWKNYDVVIFNMLPTGFGNGTMANATALFVPILLVKLLKQKNIRVIHHNSIFTNDVRKLGYDTGFDKIRSFFLGIVEGSLFKNVKTFVFLNLYKEKINESVGKNKVHLLNGRYLEAIATIYINGAMHVKSLEYEKKDIPTILMHGSWGPQKNIELGLSVLKKQKEEGGKFRLVVSGGLNHHFPEYEKEFNELLHSYSDIIDEYLGPVAERDIMKIFLKTSLLLLPYNIPGGHSGVLEQGIFFEVPTIAIYFPEYREQARSLANVKLVPPENFSSAIKEMLKNNDSKTELEINQKIHELIQNIKILLS
ncbi:MAG: glycosyltransferase [Thermoplasmatales archaeon]|nr:glycosyltransferase [Thermoplasmatales archaeon]MCW6170422.1 glycosyltransferase [Thermoplasmatales archaeon]